MWFFLGKTLSITLNKSYKGRNDSFLNTTVAFDEKRFHFDCFFSNNVFFLWLYFAILLFPNTKSTHDAMRSFVRMFVWSAIKSIGSLQWAYKVWIAWVNFIIIKMYVSCCCWCFFFLLELYSPIFANAIVGLDMHVNLNWKLL